MRGKWVIEMWLDGKYLRLWEVDMSKALATIIAAEMNEKNTYPGVEYKVVKRS